MTRIRRSQIIQNTRLDYLAETHFLGGVSNGEFPSILEPVGAGAAASLLGGVAGRPGVISLATGTTAAGSMSWRTPRAIAFGSGIWTLQATFRVPVMSDATNNFVNLIGFGSQMLGGGSDELVNGIYVYQDGNAFYLANKNTGVVPGGYVAFTQSSTTAWNNLTITVNGAANSATAVLNNEAVSVANLPTDGMGVGFHILKFSNTGLISRTFEIDYLSLRLQI